MNPKWILCDGNRWYDLYQKLLRSEKEETKQSMNTWFPPESGLREQIERVHAFRPEGFYEGPQLLDIDDGVASAQGSSIDRLSAKIKGKKPASAKSRQDQLLSMFALNMFESDETRRAVSDELMGESSRSSAMNRGSKKKAKTVVGKVRRKLFSRKLSKDSSAENISVDDSKNQESFVRDNENSIRGIGAQQSVRERGGRRASMAGVSVPSEDRLKRPLNPDVAKVELQPNAAKVENEEIPPHSKKRNRRRRHSLV